MRKSIKRNINGSKIAVDPYGLHSFVLKFSFRSVIILIDRVFIIKLSIASCHSRVSGNPEVLGFDKYHKIKDEVFQEIQEFFRRKIK